MDAMRQWYAEKPHLFTKIPRNRPGHDIYEAFASLLAARVATLRVGDEMEEGVRQGPLIIVQAVAKVEAHIADAVRRGARVLTGGNTTPWVGPFSGPRC